MAFLTFQQLLDGLPSDEIFDSIIAELATKDFPVDDWNDGAVPKTQLEGWSLALSRGYKSVASITRGGFLKLAPDSWIPVLAENLYGIIPFPATYTTGKLKFTVESGGPYSVTGGAQTAVTQDGLRYFTDNTSPISISSAAPTWIPIRAESPGSKYNVLEGRIGKLTTSLPGVSVTNVPEGADPSWITNYGNDAETPDQIRARCAARFGRLSKLQNYPEDGYISLVRDLIPQVKKVSVYTNFFQGTARPGCATLFLAGDTGPVSSSIVSDTLAAIRPYRNPLGTIFVDSCAVADFVVEGLVEVAPDFHFDAVRANIDAALLDYQRLAQIGAKIYAAEIIERVMTPLGVVNYQPFRLSDLQLGFNQVINFLPRLELAPVQKR